MVMMNYMFSSTLRKRFGVQTGFTMIELLVVVVIIAMLASLGVATYIRTQKTARDAFRRASVKSISDAMEQFYALNGTYSGGCTSGSLAAYLPTGMPTDPGGGAITCTITGGGSGFCAAATLEDPVAGNCNASCGAQTGGPVFCMKNLQ